MQCRHAAAGLSVRQAFVAGVRIGHRLQLGSVPLRVPAAGLQGTRVLRRVCRVYVCVLVLSYVRALYDDIDDENSVLRGFLT